jgi:hypothetical protein
MFADALVSGSFHYPGDDLGGEPTFALRSLVEVGRSYQAEDALPGTFAEGLLLTEFAPYRRQRRWLVEAGFQYVPLHTMPPEDRLAPELGLLPFLRERRFPYGSSGLGIEGLLKSAPDARFDERGFMQVCRGNNCSHEGSHGVMYELASRRAGGTFVGHDVAEALLVGEGFAMAFDLLLVLMLLSHERRSAPLLFSLNVIQNSLGMAQLERTRPGVLRRLASLAQTQPGGLLKLLTAAGLIANLRPDGTSLGRPFVEFLLGYAGLGPQYLDEATVMVEASLSLGVEFRRDLARAFFRFFALEKDYEDVCARPLEYHFEPGSLFHDVLPSATEIALGS